MSRIVALNALTSGINRLRNKGGADAESLYDLENGYVTLAGTIQSRPGTVQDALLPAGTKGLCAFEGAMVVFSNAARTPMPAGYTCEVVVHPDDATLEVEAIHFAGPFLGVLYVAVGFEDGAVYHYWLQRRDPWTADTFYKVGDIVEPTVRNGYAYRAHRLGDPATVWAPNVARTIGDAVEPTVPNDYQYTVIDTLGTNPKSGTTEPVWPTEDGATVNEDTDLTPPTPPSTPTPPTTDTTLPPDIAERYDGRLGTFAGRVIL